MAALQTLLSRIWEIDSAREYSGRSSPEILKSQRKVAMDETVQMLNLRRDAQAVRAVRAFLGHQLADLIVKIRIGKSLNVEVDTRRRY